MPRYTVNHSYASGPVHERVSFDAGQEVELSAADAARFNADSPGVLSPVTPPPAPVEPEPRPDLEQVDGDADGEREAKSSRNRQARPGRNRSI